MHDAEQDLMRLTEVMGAILEYVVQPSVSAADFKAYFAADPRYSWVVAGGRGTIGDDQEGEKEGKLMTWVKKMFAATEGTTPEQRHSLLARFQNDIQFHLHVDDNDFEFGEPDVISYVNQYASDLVINFYDMLGGKGLAGTSKSNQIYQQQNKPLSLFTIERAYRSANPGFGVCPACLGELSEGANATKIQYDHYFPKSIYPMLSVHPYNLVPVCSSCNNSKGEKNPLEPTGNKLHLNEVFVPYQRGGIDTVQVCFQDTRPQPKTIVTIIGRDNDPISASWALSFNHIYKRVAEDWGLALLTHHKKMVEQLVDDFVKVCKRHGDTTLDLAEVTKQLEDSADLRLRSDRCFADARSYLVGLYINWLRKDTSRMDNLIKNVAEQLNTEAYKQLNNPKSGSATRHLAVILWENAVLLDPQLADAHYNRGQLYLKLGEGNKARLALEAWQRLVGQEEDESRWESVSEQLSALLIKQSSPVG